MSRRAEASALPGQVHVFVYGTLRSGGEAAEMLAGCELVGAARVDGVLFDVDGAYPALVLAGDGEVRGEVWRCPPEVLGRLDAFEGVVHGMFRRVALRVDGTPCWTYVAGPAIAHRLSPDRRIPCGSWPPSPEHGTER